MVNKIFDGKHLENIKKFVRQKTTNRLKLTSLGMNKLIFSISFCKVKTNVIEYVLIVSKLLHKLIKHNTNKIVIPI